MSSYAPLGRTLAYAALATVWLAVPAVARTLQVGPGQEFAKPSAAIGAAEDGDTVLIAPGEYYDCAVVMHQHMTIAGQAPGAVMTDMTCQGKALLVIDGTDTTIRNLTLARARVPDNNGAGIRLEAPGLTVEGVTFENDQVGILAGSVGGEVTIRDCRFHDGGVGGDSPLYAVLVTEVARLTVEHSTFEAVKGGQISTMATRSDLTDNQIAVGTGDAPGSAVYASAGTLTMRGNTIEVGPNAPPHDAAVSVWAPATAVLRDNRLVNKTGHSLTLLLDWSDSDPVTAANQVGPGDRDVSSSGLWRHRASGTYHSLKDALRHDAGRVKRWIRP